MPTLRPKSSTTSKRSHLGCQFALPALPIDSIYSQKGLLPRPSRFNSNTKKIWKSTNKSKPCKAWTTTLSSLTWRSVPSPTQRTTSTWPSNRQLVLHIPVSPIRDAPPTSPQNEPILAFENLDRWQLFNTDIHKYIYILKPDLDLSTHAGGVWGRWIDQIA